MAFRKASRLTTRIRHLHLALQVEHPAEAKCLRPLCRRSGLLGITGSLARAPRNPSDGWAVRGREAIADGGALRSPPTAPGPAGVITTFDVRRPPNARSIHVPRMRAATSRK